MSPEDVAKLPFSRRHRMKVKYTERAKGHTSADDAGLSFGSGR